MHIEKQSIHLGEHYPPRVRYRCVGHEKTAIWYTLLPGKNNTLLSEGNIHIYNEGFPTERKGEVKGLVMWLYPYSQYSDRSLIKKYWEPLKTRKGKPLSLINNNIVVSNKNIIGRYMGLLGLEKALEELYKLLYQQEYAYVIYDGRIVFSERNVLAFNKEEVLERAKRAYHSR